MLSQGGQVDTGVWLPALPHFSPNPDQQDCLYLAFSNNLGALEGSPRVFLLSLLHSLDLPNVP